MFTKLFTFINRLIFRWAMASEPELLELLISKSLEHEGRVEQRCFKEGMLALSVENIRPNILLQTHS